VRVQTGGSNAVGQGMNGIMMREFKAAASGASLLAACLGAASGAFADSKDGIPNPSIATSLPGKGDPDGVRAALAEKGVTYGINYIGEILGNTGGLKQGVIYEGRLEGILDADLEKLWGLKGLIFHTNVFQIHGAGLSRENLENVFVASSIEALPTTRLYELYLEQKLSEETSVRFGQLAADTEFLISTNAGNFINSTFGWPGITAVDLPSGGPAYPLATPGVRVKFEPEKNFTFLAAIFDGDPAGPGLNDPQERDRYGLNFRVSDPPFLIQEAQYKYNQDKKDSGLPGTVKLGAWEHAGSFNDLRFDRQGVSIAISGFPGASLPGNFGLYGVIDQQIYRLPGDDADKGVNLFARLSASPSDRNLIDFYADGGFVFSGFIPQRPDDNFGIGLAYANISDQARAFDRDVAFAQAAALPVRSFEALLEIYYKYQIVPGLVLQPDFQYIWNPGAGGVVQPNGARVENAAIGGIRISVNY
jgi:porin